MSTAQVTDGVSCIDNRKNQNSGAHRVSRAFPLIKEINAKVILASAISRLRRFELSREMYREGREKSQK